MTIATESTKTNKHYSWALDPASGDYLVEGGNPRASTNLDVPIYIRLKTHRTKWLYAPNTQYGSDFYLNRKHQTASIGSLALNIATAAVKNLIDEGRALQIDLESNGVSRNGEGLTVTYQDKNGKENEFILVGIK